LARASATDAHATAQSEAPPLPGGQESIADEGGAPPSPRRFPIPPGIAEWLLLALAAPLLLFPNRYTPVGLGLLGASWVLRRVVTGRWTVGSPVYGPVLVLLLMLLVSLGPSIEPGYSANKFWGIVLGLAVLSTCVNTCQTRAARRTAAGLFLAGGAGVALVGLAVMAEPMTKLFRGLDVYSLLPHAVTSVQTSTVAIQGVSPNQVAGTLTLFVLLAVIAAFRPGRMRLIAAPSALVMLGVLLLTQSRSALVGVALALAAAAIGAATHRRQASLAATMAAAAVALALTGSGAAAAAGCTPWERLWIDPWRDTPQRAVSDGPSGRPLLPEVRGELWQRAGVMVLDMPFTGIGLNTFPTVLPRFYATERYGVSNPGAEPDAEMVFVPHAHNLLLQTAVDLGIVGLAAFLSIILIAVWRGMGALHDPAERGLALGLLLGLLAFGVFSLTDAVALGAKTGPALWVVLGLLCALPPAERNAPARAMSASRRRWQRVALAGVVALALLPLLAAPVALNVARIALHRLDAAPAARAAGEDQWAAGALNLARSVAWGPYVGRTHAAEALLARGRGDAEGETAALTAAVAAAPWDSSVSYPLGALHFERGQYAEAAQVWGVEPTLRALLQRGDRATELVAALPWYERARALAPDDWRPYAAAAELLGGHGRDGEASVALAHALRLRHGQVAAADMRAPQIAALAVADRLNDPAAALPASAATAPSRGDARMFVRAALLLEQRQDAVGALYAAEAATRADPGAFIYWQTLADLGARHGQAQLAAEASARAELVRCGTS
jgi:putative inorganic carbon (HCO3(-)) transporter